MNKKLDVILLFIFVAVCVHVAISVFKIITTSAPDFLVYYLATTDLVAGVNVYLDQTMPNGYIYPAVTSLLYTPFLMFPYEISQGIFVLLSTLAVPGIVYLSLKLIYKKFSWRHVVVFTSLAFLSFPTKFTLGMGQVNLLAFLLLLIGYYFYQKRDDAKSGIVLGFAFLAKPILSFVLLFFIVKKAWRVVISLFLTLTVFFLFSLLLYGHEMEVYYVQYIVPILLEGNAGREVYYNQGLLGLLSRSIEDVALRKYLSTFIGGGMLLFTYFFIRKKEVGDNTIFALLLILLPLIHSLSWQHYFVFLIFPFILTAKMLLQKKRYVLLTFLVISYLLISMNIKNPSLFILFPQNLILSHTFFGGTILWILLFFHSVYRKR